MAGGVAGVCAEGLLEVGGRAEAAIDGDFRICAVISRKAGEGEVDADAVDFFVGGAAEGFAEAGLEAPARDRQVVEHLVDPKPGGGLFANDSEGLGNDGILDFDVAGGESLDGVAGFDERDRRHGAALHKIVKSLGGEESDAVVIRRNGAERNCAEVADELFVVAAQDSHIVWDGEVECRTGLGDRMGKGVAECENAQTGRAGLAESLDGRNDEFQTTHGGALADLIDLDERVGWFFSKFLEACRKAFQSQLAAQTLGTDEEGLGNDGHVEMVGGSPADQKIVGGDHRDAKILVRPGEVDGRNAFFEYLAGRGIGSIRGEEDAVGLFQRKEAGLEGLEKIKGIAEKLPIGTVAPGVIQNSANPVARLLEIGETKFDEDALLFHFRVRVAQ